MATPHWSLDDIAWDQIDHSKVDPDILALIKAASLVEFNADDYTKYLCNVFHDDEDFRRAAHDWAVEEVQHGRALGKWAELVDPAFNFERSVQRFRDGYRVPTEVEASVRGSRCGEMIARCMVETGTSSYYTAIADRTDEPVLKQICKNIAADELRHFKLFYVFTKKYLELEQLSKFQRLKVALSRIGESEDDELAYAYFAANANDQGAYDHKTYNREYAKRAYSVYQRHHLDRAVAMIFKACGLKPHTRLCGYAQSGAWWLVGRKVKSLSKAA